MSAHTPGPWRVHQHDHVGGELWLSIGHFTHEGTSDPEGRWVGPVADLKYLIAREDEQWANARLIAAAPELLAALEMVRDADDDCRKENDPNIIPDFARAKIDAAIARAEGGHE